MCQRDGLAWWWGPGRGAVAEGAAAECVAAVWGEPPGQLWAERHDPGGVDVGVHLVVVAFDVVEIDGVAKPWGLEQVAGVGPQHRHLGELVPVALEVPVVDRVEADQGGEQPDVSFGDGVTYQVPLPAQAV